MGYSHVCRVFWAKTELFLIKDFVYIDIINTLIKHKSFKNFRKTRKNRNGPVIPNKVIITTFKDGYDFSDLEVERNTSGKKRKIKDVR